MGSRRLNDRIQALCAKAIATPEGEDLDVILTELKAALREHTERLRNLAAAKARSPQRRNAQ